MFETGDPSVGGGRSRAYKIIGELVVEPERVMRVEHPHWWLIILPIFYTGIAAGIFAGAALSGSQLFLLGAAVLMAGVLIYSLIEGLKWYAEVLIVTDRRVILSRGVLARNTSDIPLKHINDVSTKQGVVGRLLHFGQLRIESANTRGREFVTFIPNPMEIKQLLSRLATVETKALSDPTSWLSELERAALLYNAGFLTDTEFAAAKRRLLNLEPDPGVR